MSKKKTTEEFINESNKIHHHKYVYDKSSRKPTCFSRGSMSICQQNKIKIIYFSKNNLIPNDFSLYMIITDVDKLLKMIEND